MNKNFEYFEFKKYNLSNYKISNVCNKDDYINDDNETELIEPLFIVNKINEIKEKYNLNRIFIRKSGTENILRVLIEGDENHIECFNELNKYIII
jgi:phosphomannomutase